MSFGKFLGDTDSNSKNKNLSSSSSTSSVATSAGKTVVGQGCKITGTLEFQDTTEIAGTIEGDIRAYGKLIISESGKIKGIINAVDVVIQGEFQGDIIAEGKLTLLKPAKILGNVTSKTLSIEEGVSFEGKCSMPKNEKKDTLLNKDKRLDAPTNVASIKAA